MQQDTNDCLLLALEAQSSFGPGKARRRQSRVTAGGRVRASRLIENLGDFLASRNVINQYPRYNKLIAPTKRKRVHLDGRLESQKRLLTQRDHPNDFEHLTIAGRPSRLQQERAQFEAAQPRPLRFNCWRGPSNGPKRKRVPQLLGALLSRKQRNKTFLLISLFRAPIVLAALFSSLLVATLMVLYTLSFHTGQFNGHQHRHQAAHLIGSHHINSRHLQQADDDNLDEARVVVANESDFERALTVQTECGSFVGAPDGSAIAFKGIPYASPPVGLRRWTRPRPVWLDGQLCQPNKTHLAHEWRTHCAQLSPVTNRFSGHEDCLYLDIYSPQLDQVKKLPVMVYIHGGFLAYGSSGQGQVNWLRARPSAKLASELNVVLVAFNYRLQALGFLTLAQLTQNNGPDGSEGNYGLWDQLAALNWIKRNIESFAGDPNNIVLFGPDSASATPLALLSGQYFKRPNGPHKPPTPESNLNHKGGQRPTGEAPFLYSRDLFRAAWLTNPTVFYELSYELASQHYQHLFLGAQTSAKTMARSANCSQHQSASERLRDGRLDNESRPRKGAALRKSEPANWTAGEQSHRLLECLMELGAEQVVRQYLGSDDPSYRLDDQNSLPIHGIFADQFVTVDQELVQSSYPFAPSQAELQARWQQRQQMRLDGTMTNTFAAQPNQKPANQTSDAHYDLAQRATPLSALIRTNETANVGGNYDDNCLDLACTPLDGRQQRRSSSKDLLLGSTAQAVEYWPCPRNLHQWTWADFESYVATSLNSFSTNTYREASSLYGVPSAPSNASAKPDLGKTKGSPRGPEETYLMMVSDIRQICPINELARSMSMRRHRVRRYIVESRPSPKKQSSANSSVEVDETVELKGPDRRSKFAYHTWDLFAFFGFEFDPDFVPQIEDIKFQAQVRQMVRDFVHKEEEARGDNLGFTLFAEDGTRKEVSKYKTDECSMWRKELGSNYAWVS